MRAEGTPGDPNRESKVFLTNSRRILGGCPKNSRRRYNQ